MVPRWLPGSKKEPFWVTLGCLFGVFWSVISMFYIKCKVFFQDCGEFSLDFLIKDFCIYIFFTCFFMCLSLLCGHGRGCAARRGRRPLELLGHANTRSSFLLHLCLPILLMQELWSSSFKNAPALNALPVHLLRQV